MTDGPASQLSGNGLEPEAGRVAALERELAALRASNAAALASRTHETQLHVRNMLAIIRSVFQRTAETGTSLPEVMQHFLGRLDALARRQTPSAWAVAHGLAIEDIVRDELLSMGVTDGGAVTIDGPEAALDIRQAELVGLAIHELATNAVKFGVLLGTGGTLSVRWTVEDGFLHFTWAEAGVPIVSPAPMNNGFGRQFIEQALPYQLKARTALTFAPGQVVCEMAIPMPARAALEATMDGSRTG